MKLLDRYILKKFLFSFLFILCLIILIITLIDITEKNEYFIRHKLSFREIADYYYNFLPFMTNMVSPITIFITTIFVTSRLAQRTEIIAILSGGVSFVRFLVPYLIGATFLAIFNFMLIGWILADANKKRVAFEIEYVDSPYRSSSRNIHIKLSTDTYLYVGYYRSYNGLGTDVTLETIRDNRLMEKISAKAIRWVEESGQWQLKDWICRKIDGLDEHITSGKAMDLTLNLHPEDFSINPKLHEMLTLTELDKHIQKLREKGTDNLNFFLTEKYVRYMSPFAAIILTLMGVVVSARKSRGGVGLQIALGFILALIYIAFFLFARGAANVKGNNLLLTIWMPNIVFSIITLILYKLTPK
ncbi:permease YjgP/YjgQ family protein [Candidatus Amoebophilus asiaticus 5a2]|uniref:Permease YjgP/YjgQ family protein n=1 Tax=Amoebophilus asiaticus (strain 5a2) TaxID=452471 RepID=B3EU65_AMOA5|nr:LptF/LptG family permease [Candidatus Amoebophilus asiaticus]ACE05484.1 permease YjgP/YjgQ family protein [Candidatus Amoebophilus asiaticus 5a2]